jgi:methionyl aminopeptidase
MVTRKTPAEVEAMAEAGAVLAEVHTELGEAVQPGMSTAALDALAERAILERGALPAFKGFRGYPATINTSVNEQIVHGIPRPDVFLRPGDVLTVDAGVVLDGYYADAARTMIVGGPETADERTRALVEHTRDALWAGIAQLVLGKRVGDISAAIAAIGEAGGYGVVADHDGHTLAGHGIGRHLHEDPSVPGRGRPGRGLRLKPGLVLAIEPMFTLGTTAWRTEPDGWTTVTTDGSLAAHWEHTVAVTEDGPRVLTATADDRARATV